MPEVRSGKVNNRSWLTVAKDKQYLIAEERLRFPVDGDVPPALVPFTIFKDLQKAVDIFEKHRGWKLLDAVPRRKQFPGGKPCCAEITKKKAGESLSVKFMPASFQGDTDDAHNFDELSNPDKRLYEENIIDWVAIMHFWVPAVMKDPDYDAEYRNYTNLNEGFATLDTLPTEVASYLRERFKNV
jgi:hypothetical protein